jgi:hypothetical protein
MPKIALNKLTTLSRGAGKRYSPVRCSVPAEMEYMQGGDMVKEASNILGKEDCLC